MGNINVYKRAREQAGITQEKAAELLEISVGALAGYEQNRFNPSPKVVREMIIIYDYTKLAMDYFFNTPLGEYLPAMEEKEIQQAILNLVVKLNTFNQVVKNEMLEIANSKEFDKKKFCDGYQNKIKELINAARKVDFEGNKWEMEDGKNNKH